jgi:hypothetical protein
MPVIGFLASTSPDGFTERLRKLSQGLKEQGFVEGENLTILYRFAENQADRLPELATDLVRRKVAVMMSASTSSRQRPPSGMGSNSTIKPCQKMRTMVNPTQTSSMPLDRHKPTFGANSYGKKRRSQTAALEQRP